MNLSTASSIPNFRNTNARQLEILLCFHYRHIHHSTLSSGYNKYVQVSNKNNQVGCYESAYSLQNV
jgi:hypothetical protein